MTLLDAQLSLLEARFPGIRNDLCSYKESQHQVSIALARNGELTMSINGRWFYSTVDPYRDVVRSMPNIDDQADLVIVVGFGLGYHIEKLIKEHPDIPILVVEPDPCIFLRVLAVRNLRVVLEHPGLCFFFGSSPQEICSYLEHFSCRHMVFFCCRAILGLYSDWVNGLEKILNDFRFKLRVNEQTLRRFYPLWLRNHTKNLTLLKELQPVEVLRNTAVGFQAVIAAAGPSLLQSIEWIHRQRQGVILIAVDTAWDVLRRVSLIPDFLVFMDGQYWNSRHVDSIVPFQTKVVAELTSHPRALRCAPGRTYVSASCVPFLQEWEAICLPPLGRLKSGGSVATLAWELALLLGCRQVYFAGLDLGYPGSQTHSCGSQFEEKFHFISNRLAPAETRGFRLLNEVRLTKRLAWDGSTVLSDFRMDLYRDWFEVSFLDHPEVEPLNLSSSGSVIKGMKQAEPWRDLPPLAPFHVPTTLFLKQRTDAPGLPIALLKKACAFLERGLKDETFRSPDWLLQFDAYSQQFSILWGKVAWTMLATKEENAMKHFPTQQNLRAVMRCWQLALEVANFWQEIRKKNETSLRKIS